MTSFTDSGGEAVKNASSSRLSGAWEDIQEGLAMLSHMVIWRYSLVQMTSERGGSVPFFAGHTAAEREAFERRCAGRGTSPRWLSGNRSAKAGDETV